MKKSVKELWTLWKKSVGWDEKTTKQHFVSCWFAFSFVLLVLCSDSIILSILAVANFGYAAYLAFKYVPVTEEDIL